MAWTKVETDSLSNQNIATALAIGARTVAADGKVGILVLADQVAGNGDYIIYMTLTRDATARKVLPITTSAAASGDTGIAFSGECYARAGDVLTVYLDGLAGDTATPDTTVDWFESATATAAELAKVPKSDSNVSWNATVLAAINAEVDAALNTAIPGSPTADSINQRVAAIDALTEATGTGDLAAIKTTIGAAGAGLTALGDTRLANLDAAISTRVKPADTLAAVTTVGSVTGAVGSVTGDTKQTADVATLIATVGVAGAGLTALASASALDAVDNYVDTEVTAIKAVTDKLNTTLVQDGAVYDFTAAALAAALAGGTGLDAAGVRAAIGMAAADLDTQLDNLATATALATVDGIVNDILVDTSTTLPAQIAGISAGSGLDAAGVRAAVGLPAADLGARLDEIVLDTGTTLPAAIAGISAGSGLDAAGVRAAIGMAAADLDAQLDGLATAVTDLPTATDFDDLVASLSAVAVTVVSPIDPETHEISVNVSSDYFADHGWSIGFSSASYPTLTAGTVWMVVDGYATTISGTVVSPQSVRFEIPRTTLAAIGVGHRAYEVLIKLADTHQILLVSGTMAISGLTG